MNILIKLMSIVSLVIAPHIAVIDHHDKSMNDEVIELKVDASKPDIEKL